MVNATTCVECILSLFSIYCVYYTDAHGAHKHSHAQFVSTQFSILVVLEMEWIEVVGFDVSAVDT